MNSSTLAMMAILAGGITMIAQGGEEVPNRDATPELVVDIDFNDEVWLRDHKISEAEVGELVKALHDNGCTTIIYRAGLLGLLPYRTELGYPMGNFDATTVTEGETWVTVAAPDGFFISRIIWSKPNKLAGRVN